jgi:DNA-binding LacI/PurR family transcriptional regulator
MATEFLLRGGARRLLVISGPEGLSLTKLRRAGVEEACAALGVDGASVQFRHGDYSVDSGERILDALLGPGRAARAETRRGRSSFDAVFADNDRMAIGAMRSLKRHGLEIPRDIEVLGFDDVEVARLVEPPLTTIAQPAFEMGRESARLLLRLIDGQRPRKRTTVMEPALVIRGSTRPR